MTNLADSDRFAQHDSCGVGDAGNSGLVATVSAFLTVGLSFPPTTVFPYACIAPMLTA